MFGRMLDFILGRRRKTSEMEEQKMGVLSGVPTLGLDALSSAAYGPEAALTIMLGIGLLASRLIFPIFIVILTLLTIVFISYLQTISAYPNGGGSYTVASENLGPRAGLVAAASLLLDYILTAAVSISAGIGAIVSAYPILKSSTLPLCLAILLLLLLVNLRGLRESGNLFAFPTYLFVLTLSIVIAVGIYNVIITGGHPHPVEPPRRPFAGMEAITWWLLLRAFASGCTAMTGVEAVSNGVLIFKKPNTVYAQWTLASICLILGMLLFGIAFLCQYYHIVATIPDGPHYESVLSQLIRVVFGRGWYYYLTIWSIFIMVCLSANTAFADFPRLCQLLARDNYLPYAFADLSRRLVFAVGISVLTLFTAILLILFGGVTDRLIPLYAVGAFTAFTFSQGGMVVHWNRHKAVHGRISQIINLIGCIATGITVLIIFAAKFLEGAWMSLIIIGIFFSIFLAVKRLYVSLSRQIKINTPRPLQAREEPLVVVTLGSWNKVSLMSLEFALQISKEVFVLHVSADEDQTKTLRENWRKYVVAPMTEQKLDPPVLMVVDSPYREINRPLLQFVNDLKKHHTNRDVAVIVPELISTHWWSPFFQRHWGSPIKKALLRQGSQGVVLVSIPWRLK